MGYLPAATKNAAIGGAFPAATNRYWGFAGPTSPGTTGAHEVTGTASHKRQLSKTTTPTAGITKNATAMTWTSSGTWTIKYFVINALATGAGTYQGGGPLASTITVPVGSTISAAIGAFQLRATG